MGAEVIAFLDGDGSDCPKFMHQIVSPIVSGEYDFVIVPEREPRKGASPSNNFGRPPRRHNPASPLWGGVHRIRPCAIRADLLKH
jgi:hypothetical protein